MDWKVQRKTETRGPWTTSLTREADPIEIETNLNKSMIIIIRNLIPVVLYLNNLNPFLSMDNLCHLVLINLTRWFWWFWRRRFLKVNNVFLLFHNYIDLLVKRFSIWATCNLNLLHQMMLCAKFGWNWPSVFLRRFLNFINVLMLYMYHHCSLSSTF